jgi:heparan-alpha-glucosaminide N-acetyltransferase
MQRLLSIDVYRGIIMFLVGMRLMELDEVALKFPESGLWQFIGFHSGHVPWVGCSLNDLIHPSFVFLTGTALVFSVTSRLGKGQSKWNMTLHALWRSVALIFLGIFIRSLGRDGTNWTFEETLTQTGIAYMPVFALAFCGSKTRWFGCAAFLVAHWLIFVLHPIMPPHVDPNAFNVPEGWKHDFSGFFAHWNHNRNAGWSFDLWLLNEFPRARPYVGYLGGYTTLNVLSTIPTMILGLMAGTWLKQSAQPTKQLVIAGASSLTISFGMHFGGICPIIKHLWTPSWALFSGGSVFLILAALHYIADIRQWRRWAFPFVVVGMNSLAFYLMRHALEIPLAKGLKQHLGKEVFRILGRPMQPVLIGACSLTILWLVVFWMYRRKIFIKL